jgi:hypothetical protein
MPQPGRGVKLLRLLGDLAANEPEKYAAFWGEFGTVLREGIADGFSNRDEIAGLLRFTPTKSAGQEADVSSRDYIDRMKEGQQHIYYLLAPSLAAAAARPPPGGIQAAAAVGCPGHRRPRPAGRPGRIGGERAGEHGPGRTGQSDEGDPGGTGLRRPCDQPPDRLTRLHRG